MNAAQIIRQALKDINAVLQNHTTDPFYQIDELLTWATIGKNKAEKSLRSAREDHNFIHLESNDDAFRWYGIDYDPSSLTTVANTRRYLLPPDMLMLKSIRPVDGSTESVVFIAKDASDPVFQQQTDDADTASTIYYDVVGERTLLYHADPPAGVDLVIEYVPRTGPMQLYSTGTVSLSNGSASVAGGGTAWVAAELRSNLELIVREDGSAPKIVSQTSGGFWVDPSATYYPITEITSAGALTLSGVWLGADIVGGSYLIASSPPLPDEHHQSIVDYVAYRCLRKRRVPAQAQFKADFGNELAEMRADVQPRQEQSPVFIEDWVP